jgi:hypothetical protein
MVMTVTEVLNLWNEMGVFSYVIPFLLIFAVVFAILEKTKILGENKSIMSIVSVSIGLLSLQFDFVSRFFATIFPRFGVGLSIFLVLIILIGFFIKEGKEDVAFTKMKWIGIVVGVGVVVWALSSWDNWRSSYPGIGSWIGEYFWALVILGAIIGVIIAVSRSNPSVSRSNP